MLVQNLASSHLKALKTRILQGYHSGGIPWATIGLAKGIGGIAIRPAVGFLELVSKGTHGMGLVCLGRDAITGSAQRRVRAPSASRDEFSEVQCLVFGFML